MPPKIQYIIDAEGNRTAVILSIEEFENLMEDIGMRQAYCESREEERIPWEQIKAELIAEGKLAK